MLGIIAIFFVFIFALRQAQAKEYTLPMFSFLGRLNYWQAALELIKMHPFKGVGLENFNLVKSRYAHNSCLQIWAEMGILGIISFLWLIIAMLKSYKKQDPCIVTAWVVFLIHNFMDFTFFLPEVSLIWWVILGLSLTKGSYP